MDDSTKRQVLMELGQVYEKHGLTYGQVFEMLEAAKEEVKHYIGRKKFRVGEKEMPEES